MTAAISPWMWKSGMMFRQLSRGVSASVSRMFFAEAAMFAPESGTIFGRDVVPEVWSTSAMSPGSAGPGCDALPMASPARRNCSSRRRTIAFEPQHRNAELCRDRFRGCAPVCANHERLGAKVGQVELELFGAIGRVERRGRRARRDRDEGRGHLRSVRQHDRDAVVPADAERIETRDRVLRELPQARRK